MIPHSRYSCSILYVRTFMKHIIHNITTFQDWFARILTASSYFKVKEVEEKWYNFFDNKQLFGDRDLLYVISHQQKVTPNQLIQLYEQAYIITISFGLLNNHGPASGHQLFKKVLSSLFKKLDKLELNLRCTDNLFTIEDTKVMFIHIRQLMLS